MKGRIRSRLRDPRAERKCTYIQTAGPPLPRWAAPSPTPSLLTCEWRTVVSQAADTWPMAVSITWLHASLPRTPLLNFRFLDPPFPRVPPARRSDTGWAPTGWFSLCTKAARSLTGARVRQRGVNRSAGSSRAGRHRAWHSVQAERAGLLSEHTGRGMSPQTLSISEETTHGTDNAKNWARDARSVPPVPRAGLTV